MLQGLAHRGDLSGCTSRRRVALATTRHWRGWVRPGKMWLHPLLQRRRRLEPDGLAGLHLDRLAGARVKALPGLGLAYGECAEARQGEFTLFFSVPGR